MVAMPQYGWNCIYEGLRQWCAVQGKLATAALVPIRQPGGGGNRVPGLDP